MPAWDACFQLLQWAVPIRNVVRVADRSTGFIHVAHLVVPDRFCGFLHQRRQACAQPAADGVDGTGADLNAKHLIQQARTLRWLRW